MAVKSKLSKASPMKKFAANCVFLATPNKKVTVSKDSEGNPVMKDGKKVTVTTYEIGKRSRFCVVGPSATKITYYLCLKQPSKPTVNYQVQFKYGFRSKSTGKWSESKWLNAYTMASKEKMPEIAYKATTSPDYWLRANMSRKDTTLMWLNVNGASKLKGINKIKRTTNFPAKYDGYRMKYRVRTVQPNADAKKVVHGPWNSEQGCTVTFLRKISSKGVAAYRQVDGGLIFDYDFKPSGKVVSYEKVAITSIKEVSSGKELLKSTYAPKMKLDSTRSCVYSGGKCATISVPVSKLKDTIEYSTKYKVSYYILDDGVQQKYTATLTTKANAESISIPEATINIDDYLDMEVRVPALAGTTYNDIACVAKYRIGGKTFIATPDYKKETLSSETRIGLFRFTSIPPLAKVSVFTSFTVNGKRARTHGQSVTNKSVGTQVFLKSVSTDTKHMASLYADIDVSFDSKGKSSVESTYGRELPFAVFSKSTETSIKLKGTASNIPFGVDYMIPLHGLAHVDYWDDIRQNQHELYWLILPNREIYKVAIESVSIMSTVPDYVTVDVSMKEVS